MTPVIVLLGLMSHAEPPLWPVGNGEATPIVLTTYGQLESQFEGCDGGCEEGQVIGKFHTGVDLANPEGEPVFAIHSGVVVDVEATPSDPLWTFIIVESDGFAERGFMYGHLSEIQFCEGERVEAGQLLGYTMPWWEPGPGHPCESAESYDHLHLAWVKPKVPGEWDPHQQDAGHPFDQVRAPLDDTDPCIHALREDGFFRFRRSGASDDPVAELEDQPATGEIDIVASVSDLLGNGSPWAVIPHSLELEVRRLDCDSQPVVRWRLDFTKALPGIENLRGTYACGSLGAHDSARRQFLFVLTNGGQGQGIQGIEEVQHERAWTASPGEYELSLRATDFSGNQSVAKEHVCVE